jgi:beta-xylosidase
VLFGLYMAFTAWYGAQTYTNPVYPHDFPDPFILNDNGTYYAFSTNVGSAHVPILRSDTLASWTLLGDALPELPAWSEEVGDLVWAPGVLAGERAYVLYYTTRHAASGRQCISRAIAQTPEGPYIDKSTGPFICQVNLGGSIDPYPFVDTNGQTYLYWKNDGNCCDLPVGLWVQRLSRDGQKLLGRPSELIQRDQLWELPLIENPAMWQQDGRYYLFYSGNWWESHAYAVGYAVCEHATGPCRKPLERPIFKAAGSVMGPGGEAFFVDAQNQLWFSYHAWTAPYTTYPKGARTLRIDRIHFEKGKPMIKEPTETPQPLRSDP